MDREAMGACRTATPSCPDAEAGILNALQVLVYNVEDRSLAAVADSPRLARWTLAAALLPLPEKGHAAAGGLLTRRGAPVTVRQQPAAALAVGLSDNSVLLYTVDCGGHGTEQVIIPYSGSFKDVCPQC